MSYVIKTNLKNKSRFPLTLRIVVIAIIVLGLFYLLAPRALPSFFTTLASPFWNFEKKVRYGSAFVNVEDLIKENEELKRKVIENSNSYLGLELLKKENENLKIFLGRKSTDPKDMILSVILKKPPYSAYDIFVIDIGSDYGIAVGDRVYALGPIPIGEIAEVLGKTSKVKLYSSIGEKWDVLIGEKNIEAIALGRGGGVLEATLPRDTKIKKGETVSIPALSDSFFALVEDIVSDSTNPFSTILFKQPINIYEMRWVEVEKNSNQKI